MFTKEELQSIEQLLTIIENSSVRSGTLEKEGIKIQFNKDSGVSSEVMFQNGDAVYSAAHLESPLRETETATKPNEKTSIDCTAPFLGTLHLQDMNKGEPTVQVGQKVKKGDIIFQLEAMKLLNDVHAPVDGEITEVLFKHGDLIQYGDVVIRLRASELDD